MSHESRDLVWTQWIMCEPRWKRKKHFNFSSQVEWQPNVMWPQIQFLESFTSTPEVWRMVDAHKAGRTRQECKMDDSLLNLPGTLLRLTQRPPGSGWCSTDRHAILKGSPWTQQWWWATTGWWSIDGNLVALDLVARWHKKEQKGWHLNNNSR